jgi:hypothetical protein
MTTAAIQFALMGCGDKCLIFICFRLVLFSAFCNGKGVIKFLRLRVASKTMHQKVAGGTSANADWKFFHGKHFHLQDVKLRKSDSVYYRQTLSF